MDVVCSGHGSLCNYFYEQDFLHLNSQNNKHPQQELLQQNISWNGPTENNKLKWRLKTYLSLLKVDFKLVEWTDDRAQKLKTQKANFYGEYWICYEFVDKDLLLFKWVWADSFSWWKATSMCLPIFFYWRMAAILEDSRKKQIEHHLLWIRLKCVFKLLAIHYGIWSRGNDRTMWKY